MFHIFIHNLIFTNYVLFNVLKINKIDKENINLPKFSCTIQIYIIKVL